MPPLALVRDLAARHQGRAARFYYVSTDLNLAVTVVSAATNGWLAITTLWQSEAPADLLDTQALPPETAATFFHELNDLGAWTLQECRLNTRAGIKCYHAIADTAAEHCIKMDNPDLHPDPRYLQILNLYSARFLRDRVSMKHTPMPSYVLPTSGRDNPPLERTSRES